MRTIPLTQGKVAIVDDADYEVASQFKWHYGGVYAQRRIRTNKPGPRQTAETMGRFLLNTPKGVVVSYRSLDKLDNRRSNLRVAAPREAYRNRKLGKNNRTGLKGVYHHKERDTWRATISRNGKKIHLGCYDTPETAHAAYCEASAKYHGEFGRTE